MPYLSFIPDSAYFVEAQSLYMGLFDNIQSSDSSGLTYWEGVLQYDTIAALDAFSSYAIVNGSPITSANINTEINNIYENLMGVPASSGAQQYWAGLWSGDGGTLSVAQIAVNIYNYMESLPTTSAGYIDYTQKMENHLLNYYDEAQALYIGLMGTMPTANGLNYWENALATNQAGALNAISNYVTYNGQALSSSNIDSEILNIYKNLEGNTTLTSSSTGVTYWADQWTGNGGTLSIGQIAGAIYNAVETQLPTSNQYYENMNAKIDSANVSVSLSDALTAATNDSNPQSYTMPTTFSNSSGQPTSYEYVYAFPSSTTQSDILIFTASPNSNTVTGTVDSIPYSGTGAMATYVFTGDASGHNTVDVNYQAGSSGNLFLKYYLTDASNFQTLDFNYSGPNLTGIFPTLDIAQINSGFVNFILDNTGFYNLFTFNNAVNNDIFIVQSSIESLSINEATGNTSANVIMDGVNISGGYLNYDSQSLNIDSTGSMGNSIYGINFNDIAINDYILNISGSESLTVGNLYGNSITLADGSTLSINDNSAASLTIYAGDDSSSGSAGITINLSGSSAPITLYDTQAIYYDGPYGNSPDHITLGSGTDTIYTNGGNSIITVGSGADTVVVNSNVDSYNSITSSYSGYITTIEGNNSNYSADSVTFTNGIPNSVYINPSLSNETSSVSSATSESQAIAVAVETLNNAHTTNGDYAAYFQYGGNTYIINDYYNYGPSDQVVKLIGNVNLSSVTINGHTISNL